MYRVAISAALAVLLGACSLGSTSISSGFADSSDTTSVRSAPAVESVALGGEPSTRRADARADTTESIAPQRVAKLDDKAPVGSFERAPAGALADRDYTKTALDPDKARDLINQYRRDKGLKPLQLNAELTSAAKAHSRDLAQWDRISHFGSDGSNPWDRVKRTGYHARLAAENVGTGQVDFQEVLRGWKESPGHNKNLLLPDATHMGIALVQDPKTEFKSFWTLVIGASM
ncbi:MAG: CAP domain-containing protein [Hyphomicrobium sp.]